MASAWGSSWASAWGNSWGATGSAPADEVIRGGWVLTEEELRRHKRQQEAKRQRDRLLEETIDRKLQDIARIDLRARQEADDEEALVMILLHLEDDA